MAHSDILGQEYGFYGGMATASGNPLIPPQFIPKKYKTKKWEQETLDALEIEGLKQYVENLKFLDYYKMISGQMVYRDISGEDVDILFDYTQKTKEDLNINKSLRHWDLMYPIVSRLTGEWSDSEDKFRFDSTDEASTNDYIREKSIKLNQYVNATFQQELNKALLLLGIDIKEDFTSEEEYNQYQQQLAQIQQDYFPDKIEEDMKKNWKTECAIWGEKTWGRDFERFRMKKLENLEARDILLTGKAPRHYRIGYDYYYPEYWHPVETFHSKEASVDRFENCEFAGRIKYYTLNEFFTSYAHLITEKDKENIMKSQYGESYYNTYLRGGGLTNFGDGLFTRVQVPFEGYHDHKLALEFEDLTGIPQSEITDVDTDETKTMFSLPLNNTYARYSNYLSRALRQEFEVRVDTIQTTEVYWKGSKAIGILTVRKENGYNEVYEVDEDLLNDYIKEFDIKKLKKVSLIEYNTLREEEKSNTVLWVQTPMVYKGIKARINIKDKDDNSLNRDFYYVEELPFQIKGDKGNIFDLKLPVVGHIGESFCEKIRAEQITYNYLLNQNQSYLEKEIGSFFVIDVNSLPTSYFDLGEEEDTLINLRNLAKATGLLPTDLSRNNLNQNGGGMMFNPMTYQNATYTDQLNRNLSMAQTYKWMAYEKLGLTPQRMGSPDKYMNSQGINLGQEASYAQTYGIEQILLENKRSNIETHLAVAQYCQLNNLDANYIYMASDNELDFINSIKDDEFFAMRIINVRPITSPKKQRELQELKQALINTNTMGHDALSLTEFVLSDNYLELKQATTKARLYQEKLNNQKLENDRQISEQQMAQSEKQHAETIQMQKEANETKVKVAELQALGRTSDSLNDPSGLDIIKHTSDSYIKEKQLDNNQEIEMAKIKNDVQKSAMNANLEAQKIEAIREKNNIEREKIAKDKYVSDNNVFQSTINKN